MDLLLCGGTGCRASGSDEVKEALREELAKRGLDKEIRLIETGCNGFCAQGPILLVQPEGIFYQKLKPGLIPHLVEEHFLKGRPVAKLQYKEPASAETIPTMEDIPFYAKQELVVLKNRGAIYPEDIDESIARHGSLGTSKALSEMGPQYVIYQVKESGLRCRGGAGFPDGL
jgi:(2Fe-2S) ferredoxin